MMAKRLLIISPSFHDYDLAIAAAFECLGFEATTCLYDRFSTVRDKVRNKVRYELPERLGRDTTEDRTLESARRALHAVRDVDPDLVLVIKGDVLGESFWDELARRGTPAVLWLYDELRRTRWSQERGRLHGPRAVASYSPVDTASLREHGMEALHVPLGFDHLSSIPRTPQSRDITFIGARYPNRQAALESLCEAGIAVTAYGRDWSKDWRDRLRTWSLTRPAVEADRDVSRALGYGIMRAAAGTLNIHGDQDGFTIRTFEAAGVGAVQICDRADVSLHYEVGREVLVYETLDELVELCEQVTGERTRGARLRESARSRTLAEHTLVHRAKALAALF